MTNVRDATPVGTYVLLWHPESAMELPAHWDTQLGAAGGACAAAAVAAKATRRAKALNAMVGAKNVVVETKGARS